MGIDPTLLRDQCERTLEGTRFEGLGTLEEGKVRDSYISGDRRTIVVSDRIRENFRKIRKGESEHIINVSLTETLARTLVTSFTTLLVLVALAVFGGDMIHGFAIALIVGVLIGTYSSIYVAANSLLMLGISKEDLLVPVKEGSEFEELP